jgi:hypothetical protein
VPRGYNWKHLLDCSRVLRSTKEQTEGTVELSTELQRGPVLVTPEEGKVPSLARARIFGIERINSRCTRAALENRILSGLLTYVKLTKKGGKGISRKHFFFIFRVREHLVVLNSTTLQIRSRYKAFFPFISLSCCYSKTWQQYFKLCISLAHVLRKCYIMESLRILSSKTLQYSCFQHKGACA